MDETVNIPSRLLACPMFSVKDRVYLYLASMGEGWFYVGNATIAEAIASNVLQVSSAKSALIRSGLIESRKNPDKVGFYFQHKLSI